MSSTLAPPQRNQSEQSSSDAFIGKFAMAVTLFIWAGFSISLRFISDSTLTPLDVAVIRFSVPAVLLLPFIPSRISQLKSLKIRHAFLIACGAGLPFLMFAAVGGQLTSAVHVSTLIAGTSPLSVAILMYVVWRERVPVQKLIGLAVIVVGVLTLIFGLGEFDLEIIEGSLMLLAGSLLWGMFTLGVRRANVDPLTCLIVVTYPSALLAAMLVLSGSFQSHIAEAGSHELLLFAMIQGVAVGIMSPLGYAIAIRHLGSFRCAAIGALAPGLATLLAIPLLDEVPSVISVVGVICVTVGVMLSSRSS